MLLRTLLRALAAPMRCRAGCARARRAPSRPSQRLQRQRRRERRAGVERELPGGQALLGDESFAQMARAYWYALSARARRPGVARRIVARVHRRRAEQLADEPYLADCARLEWALNARRGRERRTGRAANTVAAGAADPAAIGIELMPGTRAARIDASDRHDLAGAPRPATGADDRFAPVRAAFAAGPGEQAWVWRDGWRARAAHVDRRGFEFMRSLARMAAASARRWLAGGEGFDFEAWLVLALERGSLRRAHALPAS